MIRPALLLIVASLLAGSFWVQVKAQQQHTRVLAAQTERAKEQQRLTELSNYWEKIVTDSPTYRDGFIQLAIINYRLGDTLSAQKQLQQALIIDPNYELPSTLAFLQPLVPQLESQLPHPQPE